MNNKIKFIVDFFRLRGFLYYEIFTQQKHRIDQQINEIEDDTEVVVNQLIASLQALPVGKYNVKMYKKQNGENPFVQIYDTTNGIPETQNNNTMNDGVIFQISTMLATIQLAQVEANKKIEFIYDYCKESERLRKDGEKSASKEPKKDIVDKMLDKTESLQKAHELYQSFAKKKLSE